MNSPIARYTPLESLLLFQSLVATGIDAASFLRTSDLLRNNKIVKESGEYDAGRLSPEALQELFLHLLREELKAESENNENPNGAAGQSPNSRKRKLASPPLPTLQDARRHAEKLPVLIDRLYARYKADVVREIQEEEERYERLQREIQDIEAREQTSHALSKHSPTVTAQVSTRQNGHPATPLTADSNELKLPNGGPPTPQLQQLQQPPQQSRLQPRNQAQAPVQNVPQLQLQPQLQQVGQPQGQPGLPLQQQDQPQVQPQTQAQIQPGPELPNQSRPPLAARPQDLRNGTSSPQLLQSPHERLHTATPPSLTPQPAGASPHQQPRLAATPAASSPSVRPQELPRSQNGQPQVLQPPQGVGFPTMRQGPVPPPAQGEGLQRPEGIGRGKVSPSPQPNQQAGHGQLKWEPLYQPAQVPPQFRQAQGQFPASRLPGGPQLPQGPQQQQQQQPSQPQWNAQVQSPYGSPRPLQAQPGSAQGQPLQQPLQQPQQPSFQPQPVHQQMQPQIQQTQQPVQQHIQQQPVHSAPQQHVQPTHQGPQQPSHQQRLAKQPLQQAPSPQGQIFGQFSPISQQGPGRAPSDGGVVQNIAQGKGRSGQASAQAPVPGYQHPPQNRPLAAASPTAPAGPSHGPRLPQQRTQTPQQPIAQRPHVLQPNGTSMSGPQPTPSHASYNVSGGLPPRVQPRPAIPDHVLQQTQVQQNQRPMAVSTPGPSSRVAHMNTAPQTPIPSYRPYYVAGSGTSWKHSSTPSTPRPEVGDMPSPAFEPLSPVLTLAAPPATVIPSVLPTPISVVPAKPGESATPQPETTSSVPIKESQGSVSPVAKRRGRPPRASKVPVQDQALLSPVPQPTTSHPAPSPAPSPAPHPANEPDAAIIKDEDATPQPPTDTGDTTADESLTGRRQAFRAVKRKRLETASPTPAESQDPPGPPTHVLWTRSFNKVSHSAMEQIVGHRDANLFAHQIRERDAPGYRNRILLPQDLRSIRNAIMHGNRSAAAAAAALPGGDPGTSTVLLPISEELVPPRGIVNSSQLDRELAHMLANAIMYNPDPNRGPGPAFMRSEAEVDAEDEENGGPVLGYKVDENGVVNNARAMFVEVEKLLSDMRAAEIQKGAPPTPSAAAGTRQASVAGGGAAGQGDTPADETEEATPVEGDVGNVSKRRRITRG